MPTTFQSYDLNRDGIIGRDEWDRAGGLAGSGTTPDGPFYTGGDPQPLAGPSATGGIDVGQILDFFSELTSAFGDSGFAFTPELLESFGVILPAMGMYSEFSKAQYQQDALAFMQEELGIKGQELALAREQLEFESGAAWDWYVEEFFPASMENQRLEFETQRELMAGQRELMAGQRAIAGEDTNQALERTLQAREGTAQAKEATRQAQINSEIARYQALRQIGMGRTTETADGRSVRGSGFTYGFT